MKSYYLSFIVLLSMAVLTNCSKKQTEEPVANLKDSTFARISEDFIGGFLEWRPQQGTYLGLHEYDGKAPDYSKASLEVELERLKESLGSKLHIAVYERLQKQTDVELAKLTDFLRLDSPIPMPSKLTSSLDRWKEELTEEMQTEIRRIVQDRCGDVE